jgi:predicted enzyme related to lactoylglutathione lyase
MIKHIAFTMYPVKNMARARKFYEKGLGLKLTKNFGQGKWVEYHLKNGAFVITTMTPIAPSAKAGGSIAFEVKDVDATLKKLKAAKAVVKVPPFDTPVCRMAYVLDSEGNALGLHAKKA